MNSTQSSSASTDGSTSSTSLHSGAGELIEVVSDVTQSDKISTVKDEILENLQSSPKMSSDELENDQDCVTSETKRMKSELDQSAEVLLKHTDTDSDDFLEWSDDETSCESDSSDDEASSGADFCYDEASCEADSSDDGSLCGELSENILTNLKFQLDPVLFHGMLK